MTKAIDWKPAYLAFRSLGWTDSEIAIFAGVSRAVINGVVNGTYKNKHSLEFSRGCFVLRTLARLVKDGELPEFDFHAFGWHAVLLSESVLGLSPRPHTPVTISTEKPNTAVTGRIDEVPTPEELEILKRVAERVFEIGELTGKTGKIENLKAKIAELEVRAKRLYPKDD